MTSLQFETIYKKLNPKQKEAVDTIEGPVMVIAGPGTGKTQILTVRIANILLKTDTNPSSILALTFTESGVLAMRKRLVEMIGTDGFKVMISTFHGFCNDVIQQNPEEFDDLIGAQSLTEVEQIQIIEKILLENDFELIKPMAEPLFYTKSLLSAINDLKKEGIPPGQFKETLENQKKDFDTITDLYHEKGAYKGQIKGKYLDLQKEIKKNEEMLIVYEKYQQALRKEKKYDFNDMLLQTIEALKNNQQLLMRLQEQYQFILVDEHQDTNAAQNQLVELLASFYDNPNLFVVGDEKQAIYRFQGASLENFLYFKSLYPRAKLINLEDNYRSTQVILDAASSLIKKNITSDILTQKVDLHANVSHDSEPIKLAEFHDYYAENHYIADDIQQKNTQGVLLKEIAVLTRNNKDLQAIADVLEQKGIPYNIESDQNIFTDPDIRKIILLFRAVCGFGEDLPLVMLMHADFLQINQMDLYKLMHIARNKKVSLYDLITNEEDINAIKLKNKEAIVSLYANLEIWKRLCENDNIQSVFTTIISRSGLLHAILEKPTYLDILEKVTSLFEEVKMLAQKNPKVTLHDFLDYLDLLESHDLLIKKPAKTTIKDAVRLMTAHRSKGLEFDYVYIPQSFDTHWGNMRKRGKGFKIPWEYFNLKLKLDFSIEENEDERRLYYVAITRAKKGVLISYSTCALDGKEQVPSQFIAEIESNFIEKLNIEDFEKTFAAHKEVIFKEPMVTLTTDNTDIQFFTELFYEKGLSVTALNNYLRCPWNYFYRNLLQLPDTKEAPQIFGTAVHYAISMAIRQMQNGIPISKDYFLEKYKESLLKEVSDEKIDFNKLVKKGEQILPGFYEHDIATWPDNLQSELRIGGIHLTDTIKINGMVDMIEPQGNGEVIVYDFKTGKPKTRGEIEGTTKNSNGDYKRQLVFYKLLLDQYHNGKMNMTRGVLSFIEPDEKGNYHKEIFAISKDEVEELVILIKQVADEITNLAFWEKRCDDKECEYCGLRELMNNHSQERTIPEINPIKLTTKKHHDLKDQISLFDPVIVESETISQADLITKDVIVDK